MNVSGDLKSPLICSSSTDSSMHLPISISLFGSAGADSNSPIKKLYKNKYFVAFAVKNPILLYIIVFNVY
jgi:hypothetical protein